MKSIKSILTHPGGAHKDDFLACCVLLAKYPVAIQRRDPSENDLDDPSICVIDIGDRHDPEKSNFDHHQFPRDSEPTCSLSLVLQSMNLYEDAQKFCDWLEPAEWLDCLGPKTTAERLGVEREIIGKLHSPIDVTLLRRFAAKPTHSPGEALWEVMKMTGEDLIEYLTSLRKRLDFIKEHSEIWTIETQEGHFQALYLPRTDPLPEEPSLGLGRFLAEQGLESDVIALVYPDRRSSGYALSRYNDNLSLDFTRSASEADVHFAHARGFVAKTTATLPDRLRELLAMSFATAQ